MEANQNSPIMQDPEYEDNMDDIDICTIMTDPDDVMRGPEDEMPHGTFRKAGFVVEMITPISYLAMPKKSMWELGETITVRLMGGSPKVQKKVKKYACTWLDYANLKFEFVESGYADIRVAFKKGGGSWSYKGTECRKIAQDQPTMNFGALNDKSSESVFSRTVTHEFGHALGCIHEHQNPAGNIQWKKEAVYAYYKKNNGWDRAKVHKDIFETYSVDTTNFSSFDEKSVMLYEIPATLTKNGYSTKHNNKLSAMDKDFIAKQYPYEKSRSQSRSGKQKQKQKRKQPNKSKYDDSSLDEAQDLEDESDMDKEQDSEDESGMDKLKELESAVAGEWRGFYFYGAADARDGESVFSLFTRRIPGSEDTVEVGGNGQDLHGPFSMRGTVNMSGCFCFTKSYAYLNWGYSGRLDRSAMAGTWGDRGAFRFYRTP